MNEKSFCIFTSVGRKNEPIVHRRAQSLIAGGYSVFFVVNDIFDDETVDGLKIISTHKKQGGWMKRCIIAPIQLYKILRKVDADVYQTYSVELLFICLLLKLFQGKKIIFDLREAHPYTMYYKVKKITFKTRFMIYLISLWMRFALKRFDLVITVAKGIQDYLNKWHINKVLIVGNYPIINPKHNFTLEEYCCRQNTILYYGSIYVISRQEVFFDALQGIDNVTYQLAGKFEYDYYGCMLKKHPYWEKVDFIDGFNRGQLEEMLENATISNVLRDFRLMVGCETGSNGIIKLYESMEASLPIICPDVEVYQEMMKEYKCGILVDPNDKEAIRDAIHYLINNKEAAYNMGQESRRAVLEKYNWNNESQIYLNAINNL